MYRILKNALLLGLIILLSAWGWTLYQQHEASSQDILPVLEPDKVKAKESVSESDSTQKKSENLPELNLNIPRFLSDDQGNNADEEGPKANMSTSSVVSPSSSQSINELLPEKSVPKKYFKYGYEGKEEDIYNLNLGVEKDNLNVKLGVQADKDRNTNINSVDIEVKLPE